MAWLSVDEDGTEKIFSKKPFRFTRKHWHPEWYGNHWSSYSNRVFIPKGTIKKLLGYELTWQDEPVEIKE